MNGKAGFPHDSFAQGTLPGFGRRCVCYCGYFVRVRLRVLYLTVGRHCMAYAAGKKGLDDRDRKVSESHGGKEPN